MGSGTHRFRADRESSAHRRAGSLRARKWIKDKSGDCATTEEAGATRATDAVGDVGRKSTLRCRPVSPPRSETERWATRGMERRLSGAGVLASSCHVAHREKTGCNPDGNSAARGVPCDTHRLARGNTVTRHTTTSREARRRHHTSARRRHFVLVSGTKVIANPMLENLKSRGLIFLVRRDSGMSRVWLHGQDRRESVRGLTIYSKKYTRFTVTWRFRAVSLGKKFWQPCGASARHPHLRLSRSI